jgi:hypothetical protein
VVSVLGVTVTVPLALTGPAPEIVTLVAPVARHVSTTLLPGDGETGGFAVKLLILTGVVAGFTVTTAVAGVEPFLFVAVKV